MKKQDTALFNLTSDYHGQVITEGHSFLVDEPKSVGGSNQSPNPKNYLLGALASCTAITLKMYAERKKWNLGQIKVNVDLKTVISDGQSGYKISKQIHFENDELSEEQKERLLEIAANCPISKILTSNVQMEKSIVNEIKQPITKEYANDDITIVWKPDLCQHSKKCWKNLLQVFNPQNRPWVNPKGASTETIIKQINLCPSGALSYKSIEK